VVRPWWRCCRLAPEVIIDLEDEDYRPNRFSKLSLGSSVQKFWALM
jgi:hypothetical protein